MKPTNSAPTIHTESLPIAQEAAVMYADGRIQQARAMLEQLVGGIPGNAELRAWQLLFALYRCEGDWQRFEALGTRFERVFNRAAPGWLTAEELANLPADMREGGAAYLALSGALDARSGAALRALHARAPDHERLHIDASKVSGLDQDGCAALSDLLRFLARSGTRVLLTGAARLVRMLKEALVAPPASGGYWMLLLDLYRYQGLQEDFERAALEYALATGAAPPEWQQLDVPLLHRGEIREKRDEPRYQRGPEVARLHGVLTSAAEPQLAALPGFAEDRQYVNVDLAEVVRIAPAAARELLAIANRLTASGSVVRLLRPNPLVEALLETLSLDPRVQLIRAQSL